MGGKGVTNLCLVESTDLVSGQIVWVSALLSPGALDGVAVDVGVVNRDDRMRRRFFCRETARITDMKAP